MTRWSILLRLAGVDVMPFDAVIVRPFQDGLAGKLGAIVRDNTRRFSVDPDQRGEAIAQGGAEHAAVAKRG